MNIFKKIYNSVTGKNIKNLQNEIRKQNEINEIRYRDILKIIQVKPRYNPSKLVNIACEENIATQSLDHIYPLGTANDNTRWPKFVKKCEEYFEKSISSINSFPGENCLAYLDLGCSGGGLVFDFVINGHFAIGLEGSDYSLNKLRAEWRTIPDNLYTCNITKPWAITSKETGSNIHFHIISAWDVLEHLSRQELEDLFLNVKNHLRTDGIFIGSVSTVKESGINRHITVMDKAAWLKFFETNSLIDIAEETSFDFNDFPRGTGNFNSATNFFKNPQVGFHFILRKK
jgi:2-polyprenyl-3-methyl-5-hydroxy-6-metoxy-1,4-benzoquinol methylase